MLKRLAAALSLAAVQLVPGPASAADMYDPAYRPRAESPYDDPRYADIYRHPEPPRDYGRRYEGPVYEDRVPYDPDYRRRQAYRDDYLDPLPRPPRFSEHRHYGERHAPRCLSSDDIRERLRADGWRRFRDIDLADAHAYVEARRPSGETYELRIDRCSGEIVGARALHERGYRPYAQHWRRNG